MARKFKFCAHCRRTITESELKRGLYVDGRDGILCATCAQRMDERSHPSAFDPAKPVGTAHPAIRKAAQEPMAERFETRTLLNRLETLSEQVESIKRALLYEKASAWNVIGGVAQCLALGMLVIAGMQWLDESGSTTGILLVAVLFQLMAMTFFLKGK